MGKRKETEPEVEVEEDAEVINVDFDFFDLVEDDFLSVKSLLRQLLGLDSVLFNLSALTQKVMEAKVGTTIKADDEEYNDALAVFAIADFDPTKDETAKLMEYWLEVVDTPELLRALHKLKSAGNKLGILISERFLNMPYDVVPPLYTVLSQEYDAKKLNYDYLLVPSRVYAEVASKLDGETSHNPKRGAGTAVTEYHPFHAEDSIIDREAVASGTFKFKTPVEETDSRRAFQDYGIHPYGHLAILDAKLLGKVAQSVSELTDTMEE